MSDLIATFFEAIKSSNLQKVTSILSSNPFMARSKVKKEHLIDAGGVGEKKMGLLPLSSLRWNELVEVKRGCEFFGSSCEGVDGVQLALILLVNDDHHKFEKKEIARQLIKNSSAAFINVPFGEHKNGTLHLASFLGDHEIVKEVLAKGGDVNMANAMGKLPVDCLGRSELRNLLLPAIAIATPPISPTNVKEPISPTSPVSDFARKRTNSNLNSLREIFEANTLKRHSFNENSMSTEFPAQSSAVSSIVQKQRKYFSTMSASSKELVGESSDSSESAARVQNKSIRLRKKSNGNVLSGLSSEVGKEKFSVERISQVILDEQNIDAMLTVKTSKEVSIEDEPIGKEKGVEKIESTPEKTLSTEVNAVVESPVVEKTENIQNSKDDENIEKSEAVLEEAQAEIIQPSFIESKDVTENVGPRQTIEKAEIIENPEIVENVEIAEKTDIIEKAEINEKAEIFEKAEIIVENVEISEKEKVIEQADTVVAPAVEEKNNVILENSANSILQEKEQSVVVAASGSKSEGNEVAVESVEIAYETLIVSAESTKPKKKKKSQKAFEEGDKKKAAESMFEPLSLPELNIDDLYDISVSITQPTERFSLSQPPSPNAAPAEEAEAEMAEKTSDFQIYKQEQTPTMEAYQPPKYSLKFPGKLALKLEYIKELAGTRDVEGVYILYKCGHQIMKTQVSSPSTSILFASDNVLFIERADCLLTFELHCLMKKVEKKKKSKKEGQEEQQQDVIVASIDFLIDSSWFEQCHNAQMPVYLKWKSQNDSESTKSMQSASNFFSRSSLFLKKATGFGRTSKKPLPEKITCSSLNFQALYITKQEEVELQSTVLPSTLAEVLLWREERDNYHTVWFEGFMSMRRAPNNSQQVWKRRFVRFVGLKMMIFKESTFEPLETVDLNKCEKWELIGRDSMNALMEKTKTAEGSEEELSLTKNMFRLYLQDEPMECYIMDCDTSNGFVKGLEKVVTVKPKYWK